MKTDLKIGDMVELRYWTYIIIDIRPPYVDFCVISANSTGMTEFRHLFELVTLPIEFVRTNSQLLQKESPMYLIKRLNSETDKYELI